jgi:PIN domain nuclease of toxin-antitoxin system
METIRHILLLDTNVLLIALIAPERLPADARASVEDPGNDVLFSAASIWEIAIKSSLARDSFNFEPREIEQLALDTGFQELPVHSVHCHAVAHMPWLHRDPFDRLLVAQAQALPAYLLTTDSLLPGYSELVRRIVLQ